MARTISVDTIVKLKKLENKYRDSEWLIFNRNEASEYLGIKKSVLYAMLQSGKKLGYVIAEKERKNVVRVKILWEELRKQIPVNIYREFDQIVKKDTGRPTAKVMKTTKPTEVVETIEAVEPNPIINNFIFDGPFGKLTTFLDKENNPLFVAKEICGVLGLTDVSMSLKKLDDDEKLIQKLFVSGQYRKIFLVNESGFYNLVLRSNKPQAKKFKKWVTAEVLPSIRKHGMYATPQTVEELLDDPDAMITLLQKLKEERGKVKQMSREIKELSVKAEYGKAVALTEGSLHIGAWAKTISRKHNIILGRTKAFGWLRDNKYLMANNEPYQRYIDNGWFETRIGKVRIGNKYVATTTTYITTRGQVELTPRVVSFL